MMQRPFKPPPGRPKGPDHVWREMRVQSSDGFTLASLHGATNGVARATVRAYLRWCLERGYVTQIGETPALAGRVAHVYRVVDGAPTTAPVQRRDDYAGERGRVKEQLWTAIRALPAFGVAELAFAATTEEHPVKPRTAERYIRELAGAGVLLVLKPYRKGAAGRAGARAGQWRLKPSRNTGPKPLKWIKGRVFDPNSGQWLGKAKEEAT